MNVRRTQAGSGEPWRVQLLGTFRVARKGRSAAFRTKKTASLLAYLAFYAGRRVSKELLVDALWPEADAEKGRHSLRVALSSLRATFEDTDWDPAQYLWSDREAIELKESGFSTDVVEFQSLVAEPGDRKANLEKAVSLYAGHFLPGFSDPWILPQALELEEAFAQAVCELIDLKEDDLSGAVVIGRRALGLCPTREDLHIALMKAYVRGGQTSQAVKQFEELEKMLDETWGEMPSEEAIAVLDSMPRRGAPEDLPKAALVLSREAAPIRTTFFGRESEIRELQTLLSKNGGSRLITLLGLGGSGKTRLGIRVWEEMIEPLNGRAWYVPLVGLEEPEQLHEALLTAVSIVPEKGVDALDAAGRMIGHEPALLVLDNAEQIVAATRETVEGLLDRCAGLSILITSRVPVGAEGERLYPVQPLPLPADYRNLAELRSAPSVQLLVDAAQGVRPGFAVSPANAQSVHLLSQKLEGIPLAIELAAAKLGTLTPAQVIASISRRLDLSTSRPEFREQHRSLRTIVEWSLGLLGEEQRRAFSTLGVCRGGFNIFLAESLLGPNAESEVGHLCRCSLVGWNETSDDLRFEMLETVREMAAALLADDDELQALAARNHFEYVSDLCRSDERVSNPAGWVSRILADTGNILAALEYATAGCVTAAEAWQMTLPLQDFIDRRGRPQIWLGPFQGLLKATRADLDDETRARAHMLLAATHYGLRDIRPTHEQYLLAQKAADASGDRLLRIETRTDSISAAITLGEFKQAQKALEEAIALLPEDGGDPKSASMCHLNLAWVIFDQGREEESEPHFQVAVEHAEACGDDATLAGALTGYAAAIGHTRHDEAQLIFERARALWVRSELPARLAHLYYNRAMIDYRHDKHELAQEHIRRSLAMFVECGVALGQSALTIGGNIMASAGRHEDAALLWGRADIARERQGMLMIPFMRRDFEKELPKVLTSLTPAQIEEARQRAQGITDQGLFDLIFDKEPAST